MDIYTQQNGVDQTQTDCMLWSNHNPICNNNTSSTTSASIIDSNNISNITCRVASLSDEVMLASTYPKKRAGRKKFRETRHPVFRGVRSRNSDKWVCEVREPNKKSRIWLGTFPTAEMAARAHDVAALAMRGRSACLNFADSAWSLPVPASRDAKDIQKAAAEAAEAFRPSEGEVSRENAGAPETEAAQEDENRVFYMDEELVFGMPGLLTNMALAEGMFLPNVTTDHNDMDYDNADVPLWSYSI